MLEVKIKGAKPEKVKAVGSMDYICSEILYTIGLVYGSLQIADPDKADLFKRLMCAMFGPPGKDKLFTDDIGKFIKEEQIPVEVVLLE